MHHGYDSAKEGRINRNYSHHCCPDTLVDIVFDAASTCCRQMQIIYRVDHELDSCAHDGCGNPDLGESSIKYRALLQSPEIQLQRHPILRKMKQTSNPIYFLHIGKAGGTSIDKLIQRYRRTLFTNKKYYGFNHFDWSYIQMHMMKKLYSTSINMEESGRFDVSGSADVITFLRNPVSRSISQFYYSKTLDWAKNIHATFIDQTLEEYVHDSNKTWFQPLNDGEGGVDFLSGIFKTNSWVMTDDIESEAKEYLRQNKTAACLLSAKRLEQTVWFGLLEDVDRSMKLLQISLGLPETPELQKKNIAKVDYPAPSNEIKKEIERRLPKDMWLYDFAKRLFEARWDYFMGVDGHIYVPPELPPLPEF